MFVIYPSTLLGVVSSQYVYCIHILFVIVLSPIFLLGISIISFYLFETILNYLIVFYITYYVFKCSDFLLKMFKLNFLSLKTGISTTNGHVRIKATNFKQN